MFLCLCLFLTLYSIGKLILVNYTDNFNEKVFEIGESDEETQDEEDMRNKTGKGRGRKGSSFEGDVDMTEEEGSGEDSESSSLECTDEEDDEEVRLKVYLLHFIIIVYANCMFVIIIIG